MPYLLKILFLIIISGTFIFKYYQIPFHIESSSQYSQYFLAMLIIYGVYKFITIKFSKQKLYFSPLLIIGLCLLQVLILCFIYFNITGLKVGVGALTLFLKIVGYLILPFFITITSYSFAKKILSYIPGFQNEENIFKFLISLGLGFVFFLLPLIIFGALGLYNIWTVTGIFIFFIGFSYKEFIQNFISLYTYKIELPNHKINGNLYEQINLYLLSTEFLFIVITFLIGVNFINIVRPMPIGWDDLGVYMNFPQIMANSGYIIKGVGMISWQVLTGIGFMFHSAPQAFFLNQLGGILSIIVIITALYSILKTSKKVFLNLPLLGATVIYSMPMIIFEQAKDMKLDPGLLFISIISVYLLFYLALKYLGYEEENNNEELISGNNIFSNFLGKINSVFKTENGDAKLFDKKEYLIYLFIIGAIVGLAFSIKFTTLMLILASIGVIFYIKLGLAGFLAYFAGFIGIFTKLKLWDYLNINYPKDDLNFINFVFISCLVISIALFIYAFYKYKLESIKKAFILVIIFSLGIFAGCSPWFVKNVFEVKDNINLLGILIGKSERNFQDLSKIYSKEELVKIEEANKVETTSSSGKTTNEDLGRYFGYEDGINNYLKLPINLTMQSNQNGEYTEITYIFLALIPVIFIFLSFKNPFWLIGLILGLAFEYFYFLEPSTGKILTAFFSKQFLPYGYLYIIIFSLLPLIYFLYGLKNDKISQIFKLNMVFSTMYILIFILAAYGIVWYGIVMYFSFIVMIMTGGYYLVNEDLSNEKNNLFKFFGSIIFLFLISVYFFNSSYPHGFNNLKNAGFGEFKAGLMDQETGIFFSRPDYFSILATLNISDQDKVSTEIVNGIKNEPLKKVIIGNLGNKVNLSELEGILKEIRSADLQKLGADPISENSIKLEAKNILTKLYKTVLYPPKELQNNDGIYRIGTFLTYFISNNLTRYYDDSLMFQFDKYFYDKDSNLTILRMQKMGLKYLLVDLNAATIDKDPRHDLTRRFENLLKTFKNPQLELVKTDSICLQVALEEKNDDYMTYAGVNYESYNQNGELINRGVKQVGCFNHIIELIQENKVTDKSYTFLMALVKYLKAYPPKNQKEMADIFQNYVGHGYSALFRIK